MMTNNSKTLSDVLYALALAMPKPNTTTLEAFVRRYPQHADALTEFAVELALDPEAREEDESAGPEPTDAVSPAVSRAISHFHNIAFELEKGGGIDTAFQTATNPFANLGHSQPSSAPDMPEETIPQNASSVSTRDVNYDFLDLSYPQRMQILTSCSLLEDGDGELNHGDLIEEVIKRARDRNLLDDFIRLVQEAKRRLPGKDI